MEDARGISRQQLRKDRSGTSSGYEGDRRRCGDERAGRFPEELWMRLSAGILFSKAVSEEEFEKLLDSQSGIVI